MSRAAAAWNDRDDPGGAEAAPARRDGQPRSSRLNESWRAYLDAAWRAGASSATGPHGRSGDEPGHGEPGDREASLARQPEARQGGDQLSPDAARVLLMLATFKLQMRLAMRRARLKNRRPKRVARPIVRRGKRQRRSKNSSALNKKIVTWRPTSQEVSGEKGPKRQWGLPIVSNGGMCAEQRADYQAACDGKIAWSVYFAKWGPKL